MSAITLEHFQKLTIKGGLPEFLVLNTVRETIDVTLAKWNAKKMNYARSPVRFSNVLNGIWHA